MSQAYFFGFVFMMSGPPKPPIVRRGVGSEMGV